MGFLGTLFIKQRSYVAGMRTGTTIPAGQDIPGTGIFPGAECPAPR